MEQPFHIKDDDCVDFDNTGTCIECGVGHGDPCPKCGARAFHKDGCPMSDASSMERALIDFLDAGQRLVEAWDDTKVRHYPKYLPSFDEFIADFTSLIEEEKL